jgi:DNA-binding response OmpR family regulator
MSDAFIAQSEPVSNQPIGAAPNSTKVSGAGHSDARSQGRRITMVLTPNEALYDTLSRRFNHDGKHSVWWSCDHVSLIRKLMHARIDLLIVDVGSGEDVNMLMHWRDLHRLNHLPMLLVNLTAETEHWLRALTPKDDAAWGAVPQEIYARGNRLVDQAHTQALHRLAVGCYTLDRGSLQVTIDRDTIKLSEREFKLAWLLFSHAGMTVKRDALAEIIWGAKFSIVGHTLTQHIYQLKNKLNLLGTHDVVLRSVYGVGYRIEQVSVSEILKERARSAQYRQIPVTEARE